MRHWEIQAGVRCPAEAVAPQPAHMAVRGTVETFLVGTALESFLEEPGRRQAVVERPVCEVGICRRERGEVDPHVSAMWRGRILIGAGGSSNTSTDTHTNDTTIGHEAVEMPRFLPPAPEPHEDAQPESAGRKCLARCADERL
jgi:hypothetical protein